MDSNSSNKKIIIILLVILAMCAAIVAGALAESRTGWLSRVFDRATAPKTKDATEQDEGKTEPQTAPEKEPDATPDVPAVKPDDKSEDSSGSAGTKAEEIAITAEEAYRMFLDGKLDAVVDDPDALDNQYVAMDTSDFPYNYKSIFTKGEAVSFAELKDLAANWDDVRKPNPEVFYTYLDCRGEKILAVKFAGIDIYAVGDDSVAVFIFKYYDGELHLTYSFDAWARSRKELYSNGYITGDGSSGASFNNDDKGFIDQYGKYINIYYCDTNYWLEWEDADAYYKAYGEEKENIFLHNYKMGDKNVYTYELLPDRTLSPEDQEFIKITSLHGLSWASPEEVEEMIIARMKTLGVSSDIYNAKLPIWTSLGHVK